MSNTDFEFLKKLRTTLWQVSGLIVFSVIVASVAFYFNTNKDIEYLKQEQVKKADKAVIEQSVKDIKEDVKEIKQDIKDLRNSKQ